MKVLKILENKKILILYLIGVLLLSFGVSFAYFIATSSTSGDGVTATNVTATIESEGIVADGNIGFNNVDIYPGHKAVASIKVTGKGENKPLMFDVIFNGSNTFNTPLNYAIYKSDSNINASYTCEKKTGYVGSGKTYYEECTGNNIEQLGSSIKTGAITNGEGIQELVNNEIIVTSSNGTIIYYYVVIEFPNNDANQNEDMGASISGNITIQEGNKYQSPELLITENLTTGDNGWHKSAILTTNITTQTGNYKAEYCITTEDSCIPDQTISITDNSFNVTLNSNRAPQKLCVRVTDEYDQVKEGCSNTYQVDGMNPSINITSSEVTENSISVTVGGSDSHSGIYQYRFSSDGGSSYTDITTSDSSYTYTFNNLESGTSYNIVVQIIDTAGNVGSINQTLETKTLSASDFIEKLYPDNQNILAYDDYGNLRYIGANPNNYVLFNNELWRIIGVFSEDTHGLAGQKLVKLIRSESIGNDSWDSRITNNWSRSSLQTTLNNEYLNGTGSYATTGIKSVTARNMIESVTWKLGGLRDGDTAATFYNAERGTTVYSGNPTTWNGKVALMYPSDYGYATSGGSTTNRRTCLATALNSWDSASNCSSNDWLFDSSTVQWTLTPNSSANTIVFYVYNYGDLNYYLAGISYGVRPSIYLKSSTTIYGGNGTSSNPYRIS